ncbi:hypothetical protein ABZ741_04780 [Streptomyces globisporus]|uniref:hypothetical protein n=1 Tax=Streptomyces globisporus TaxID=1908 RepID=UPI0034600FE4
MPTAAGRVKIGGDTIGRRAVPSPMYDFNGIDATESDSSRVAAYTGARRSARSCPRPASCKASPPEPHTSWYVIARAAARRKGHHQLIAAPSPHVVHYVT